MGRRQRQRTRGHAPPELPTTTYGDRDGDRIAMRGVFTPPSRMAYARIRSGADLPAAANREDAWQRAVEYLFERLVVSWTIAGTPPLEGQRALLARLRVATPAERSWVRDRLREHCEEFFPDVQAP